MSNIVTVSYLFRIILLVVTMVSGYCFAQITNPNSICFRVNTQQVLSQKNDQYLQPTINGNSSNFQPPLRLTAREVQRQVNEIMIQSMGNLPPTMPTPNNPFPQKPKNYISQQQRNEAILRELREDQTKYDYLQRQELNKQITNSYKAVYAELLKMHRNEISFSLKKSVFMIENVYSDYKLKYSDFQNEIQSRVNEIRLIMKKFLKITTLGRIMQFKRS